MSNAQFGIALIFFIVIYGLKMQIIKVLKNFLGFHLRSDIFNYILSFLLVLLLIFGMLIREKPKNANTVDDTFKKMGFGHRDRPHPLFDIDTYW
jgi:hypothetical protein